MSEEYVQLQLDGTGKKLRTIKRADDRHEEVTIPVSVDGTIDLKTLRDLIDSLTKALDSVGQDSLRVKTV